MRQIPKAATLYYLDKAGETYIQGDDSIIGVPIGLYLPDRKTAIEFYKPHGNIGISYKEEWVKKRPVPEKSHNNDPAPGEEVQRFR